MTVSAREQRAVRRIQHVLVNCECLHAQTGMEAMGELDVLLAALRDARTRTETLKTALGPFLLHPRYLSIGSHENTVELRVSRAAFARALDAAAALPSGEPNASA